MLTIQQLKVKIAGVKISVANMRANVQTILCHAAGHAYEHGDVTVFTSLFAETKGADRKAMTKWVHEYGFAMLQKDGTFRLNKAAKKDAAFLNGDEVVDYLTSDAVPEWYAEAASAGEIVTQLDIAKRIESLAKMIANAGSGQSSKKVNVVVDTTATQTALEHLRSAIQEQWQIADNAKRAQEQAAREAAMREAEECDAGETMLIAAE